MPDPKTMTRDTLITSVVLFLGAVLWVLIQSDSWLVPVGVAAGSVIAVLNLSLLRTLVARMAQAAAADDASPAQMLIAVALKAAVALGGFFLALQALPVLALLVGISGPVIAVTLRGGASLLLGAPQEA